jgi:glycosyltransferase involved in cell wall biosynthesis
MIQQDKLLSICVPAYNRPIWFTRALSSVISNLDLINRKLIEVIISDDSTSDECFLITEQIFKPINIDYRYVSNQPRLGMAANWNNSIKLASGKYVLILHDDDFLLDGAITKIIRAINKYKDRYSVLLFGVNVVNEQEKIIKRQIVGREKYLTPKQALIKLLSNSSFIRFPAIVIQRKTFTYINYFNHNIGEIADLEMWIRLCSKDGVFCLPDITCAYTIHSKALTNQMFNERVIKQLLDLFSELDREQVLSPSTIEHSKSNFFHQFILAGAYRQIKQNNLTAAKKIMELFHLSYFDRLYFSWKWFGLRSLFSILLLV